MKYYVYIFCALITNVSFCQISKTPPIYYLNDKLIDINCFFFYPKNIQSIYIKNDKPNGEVFLKTNDIPWKYKTLDSLLKTHSNYSEINNKSVTPVFVIDDRFVKNPDSVRIDDSFFASVAINKLSEAKGVEGSCKAIILVTIKLADNPKKFIRVRGNKLYNTKTNADLRIKKRKASG